MHALSVRCLHDQAPPALEPSVRDRPALLRGLDRLHDACRAEHARALADPAQERGRRRPAHRARGGRLARPEERARDRCRERARGAAQRRPHRRGRVRAPEEPVRAPAREARAGGRGRARPERAPQERGQLRDRRVLRLPVCVRE
jgi:hypothetical protein